MEPVGLSYKIFDSTVGPRFFRRWADQSLDALGDACVASGFASGAADGGA
jgi:hypothetical protein